MSKKSLYNIRHEYVNAIEDVEEYLNDNPDVSPDNIPIEYLERIEINRDEMSLKLRDYNYRINVEEGEIIALKDEIERLQRIVRRKEKLQEFLKQVAINAVKLYGDVTKTDNHKFKTDLVNVGVIYSKPIKIIDEDNIPNKYKREVFKIELSPEEVKDFFQTITDFIPEAFEDVQDIKDQYTKTKVLSSAIKDALKAGDEVPGAEIDKEACYIRFY